MLRADRKKRKTDSEPDIYQGGYREAESERVHKGAVADACVDSRHTLDMRSLLYSLRSLLEGEERPPVAVDLESERPLAVSRASSIEESDKDEGGLIVGLESNDEELERIEDSRDVASSSVGRPSVSVSFFRPEQSVFVRNYEAIQRSYGTQKLSSEATDIIDNPSQNG